MLSVDQCKKYLSTSNYSDSEIAQLRESLYLLADAMVCEYLLKKGEGNNGKANASPGEK